MDLIKDNVKMNENINQDIFFGLLKNQKIKAAINAYVHKGILINYNNKERFVPKKTWIQYLNRTILNKFTEVVQFKVEKISGKDEESSFKIFMICKKLNGTLDFTEICVSNNWEDNYINKMQYKLINH